MLFFVAFTDSLLYYINHELNYFNFPLYLPCYLCTLGSIMATIANSLFQQKHADAVASLCYSRDSTDTHR